MAGMIDTHTYYLTLKEAGFDDRQAEAVTKGLASVVYGGLATKTDVAELRTEIATLRTDLKTDIGNVRIELANLRTELQDDIARSSERTIQRTVGLLGTYTTFVVAIAAVVNHFFH